MRKKYNPLQDYTFVYTIIMYIYDVQLYIINV